MYSMQLVTRRMNEDGRAALCSALVQVEARVDGKDPRYIRRRCGSSSSLVVGGKKRCT